jgi:hypothetical protein
VTNFRNSGFICRPTAREAKLTRRPPDYRDPTGLFAVLFAGDRSLTRNWLVNRLTDVALEVTGLPALLMVSSQALTAVCFPQRVAMDTEFLHMLGSLLVELIEPALTLLEIYLDMPKRKK